jgi:hypothetical protein
MPLRRPRVRDHYKPLVEGYVHLKPPLRSIEQR